MVYASGYWTVAVALSKINLLTFLFLCLAYRSKCSLFKDRSWPSSVHQKTPVDPERSQSSTGHKCWCGPHKASYNDTNVLQIAAAKEDGPLDFSGVQGFLSTLRSPKHAGDRNVAIIGIVGAYRSGKSTLLNILHRYLACQESTNSDSEKLEPTEWLYEDSNSPGCPRIFEVSSQQSLCTKGVWITKDPYVLREQNLAVYLMDTQGLFDNSIHSSMVDSSVFYLASLLSSTLIVNVKQHLDTSLTSLIGAFTLRLGRGVQNESDLESVPVHGKPLQQLLFLIRDYHLQPKSGKDYLAEYYRGSHRGSLEEVRQAWADVDAFLLPTIALRPHLLEIEQDHVNPAFEIALAQLFLTYFSKTSLLRKTIFKRVLKGRDLAKRLEIYLELLRTGRFPAVQDLYKTECGIVAESDAAQAYRKLEAHLRQEILQCPLASAESLCIITLHKRLLEQHTSKLKHRSQKTCYSLSRNSESLLEEKARVLLENLLTERAHQHLQLVLAEKTKQLSRESSEREMDRQLFLAAQENGFLHYMMESSFTKTVIGIFVTIVSLYFLYCTLVCLISKARKRKIDAV